MRIHLPQLAMVLALVAVPFFFVGQTISAEYLPPGTDCAKYGTRPNCQAVVNGQVVNGAGICDQYKSQTNCGCTPSSDYRNGSGECPDGVADGSSISCRADYNGKAGLENCNNVGGCGNAEVGGAGGECGTDADCIDASASVCTDGICMPKDKSGGSGKGGSTPKACVTNDQCSSNCCSGGICVGASQCQLTCEYIDCAGAIEGSAIDENGNPTIVSGGGGGGNNGGGGNGGNAGDGSGGDTSYQSRDRCRISNEVSTQWAAQMRVKNWSAGARREWISRGETYWLAGSGSDDAICTDCNNVCPGSEPWRKVNTTTSMDCVDGRTSDIGSEGIKNLEVSCESCTLGNTEQCKASGSMSYGIKDLAFNSSCDWDYHCRPNSVRCGAGYTYICLEWNPDIPDECIKDKGLCEPSAPTSTTAWNKDYVHYCGEKSQCLRQIKAKLTRDDSSDGTCAEETGYEVIFNEATCAWSSGTLALGSTADWNDMNPADCKTPEHTANFYVNGADSGRQGFTYNSGSGRCEALWTRLAAPDGVNGLSTRWGEAGSNGRWILLNGDNRNTGWQFDDATCTFYCEGYDGGADCYGKELDARLAFVPDLRLVVYRDNGFIAKAAPSSGYGQEFDNNCTSSPSIENGNLNSPINATVEGFKDKRQAVYQLRTDGRSLVPLRGVFSQGNYQTDIYRRILSSAASAPVAQEMILGVDSNGVSIKNSEYNLSVEMKNLFNSSTDEGYWACSCPNIDAGNNYQADADCNLWFFPGRDVDICTTKRIYVGLRSCYTSSWWQVSGGNIYADQDIVDSVPTGLNNDPNCNPLGNPQCEDVNPPVGHVNDFPDLPSEQPYNIAGDESCTPRIIRGRTPCKTDGPSNSAGIALTKSGQVVSADTNDYYFNNSALSHSVKNSYQQRISERSNLHALYQGGACPDCYPNNLSNPAGLQAKIANSRVLPSDGGSDGFRPPREDYRYFVSLYGGEEKLEQISGERSGLKVDSLEQLLSRCEENETGNNIDYVCYVDRDLVISSDQPWVVTKTATGKTQSITIFVNGSLTLSGNIDDSNAVTAVDIGNFLAFIVSGEIQVDSTVGIQMPAPTSSTLIKQCWEGQSATIRGVYPKNNEALSNRTSAVGAAEGIFVADGNIVVQNYGNQPSGDGDFCRVDKRFIGQGSFVSWGTVKMLRDFSPREANCQNDEYGVYNSRVPTETFIYRPDLVRNTPDWMKRSSTIYREITGGS